MSEQRICEIEDAIISKDQAEAFPKTKEVENNLEQGSEDFEEIDILKESRLQPSIDEPPELELKTLLTHLEYAFLMDESKLPMIVASNLSTNQKDKLVNMLKRHKSAISWKILDIKGINPSFCTHKILMDDNYKSVI